MMCRASSAGAETINNQIGTLFIHLSKVKIIEKVTDDAPMDTQSTYHNLSQSRANSMFEAELSYLSVIGSMCMQR